MKRSRFSEEEIIGILKEHSRPASRCKMGLQRVLSDAFETNASTSTCSEASSTPAGSSKPRVSTTYNTGCPHTGLDGLTPAEFATRPTKGHNQNGLYL